MNEGVIAFLKSLGAKHKGFTKLIAETTQPRFNAEMDVDPDYYDHLDRKTIRSIETAKKKGIKAVVLTGKDGGKLAGRADVEIRVPHFGFADRIQEVHIKVIHILIHAIEVKLEA